jgi:hypothetical protein
MTRPDNQHPPPSEKVIKFKEKYNFGDIVADGGDEWI